jgi:pimeloyl-ACP methyl ester carboxylesterase
MAQLAAISRLQVGDVNVFYRQAGPSYPKSRTVLLLHGFPSSSHQFRNLIPLLASKGYRVIAPDLPGFGFTTFPDKYTFTFDNIAKTIDAFTEGLKLDKFAIYIFDYGAPTGMRLALKHPEKITAIVSQNGNAYEEGLGADFWAPLKKYWASGADSDRDDLRGALSLDVTKWQYTAGNPKADELQPEAYYLDQALLDRPGNAEHQLALFYDYRSNLTLYPSWHEYFRSSNVPVLAMWGKNDTIFVAAGAEAFKKDVKRLEVKMLDAGHFAIEGNEGEVADAMDRFFHKFGVFGKSS